MKLKRLGHVLALRVPWLGTLGLRGARRAGKRLLGSSDVTIRNGNWSGNDTTWRMSLDLNRALLFGNSDGRIVPGRRRKYIAIVDGIVSGEGNGPISPKKVSAGVLLSSTDPAAVDAVAARLMGFDIAQLPIVREAFARHELPISDGTIDDVRVSQVDAVGNVGLQEVRPAIGRSFEPHFGWLSVASGNDEET